MITALTAAKAYAATQANAGAGGVAGAGASGGSAFADMVKNAVQQTVDASKNAETQMAAQVQGKAELVDVVTAISAAEASLETVMAGRDQVIAADPEIMRMPV